VSDPLFPIDTIPTVKQVDDLQSEGDAQLGRLLVTILESAEPQSGRELEGDVKAWATRTRIRRVLADMTRRHLVIRYGKDVDDFRYRLPSTGDT
jgi:hypothetical protein